MPPSKKNRGKLRKANKNSNASKGSSALDFANSVLSGQLEVNGTAALFEWANAQEMKEFLSRMEIVKSGIELLSSVQQELLTRQALALNRKLKARSAIYTKYKLLMSNLLEMKHDELSGFFDKDNDGHIIELFLLVLSHAPLHGMSQTEYHRKLLEGTDMELIHSLQQYTPVGRVRHESMFAYEKYEKSFMEVYLQAIDKHLQDTDFLSKQQRFPAVDLASGSGVFPMGYARHYESKLEWYPSELKNQDRRNPLIFLRESLKYQGRCDKDATSPRSKGGYTFGIRSSKGLLDKELLAVEEENDGRIVSDDSISFFYLDIEEEDGDGGHYGDEELVCADANGVALFLEDRVQLCQLRKEEYNGLQGSLDGQDPNSPERVAVLLDKNNPSGQTEPKPVSFKPSNLIRIDEEEQLPSTSYAEAAQKEQTTRLARELLQRSCHVDVEDASTWRDITNQVGGQCAVVTCTSLLTQVGKRLPFVWQNTMQLASTLLGSGGIFLQHDSLFGDFGRVGAMQKLVADKFLNLEPLEICEPIKDEESSWGRMMLLVWRKK